MKLPGTGWLVRLFAILTLTGASAASRAEPISVPNHSFESPLAPTVSPFAIPAFTAPDDDDWLQTPVPGWWPATPAEWDQSAGVFFNVPGEQHITNADGDQLAYIFATPDMGVYQDLETTYEIGRSYRLTVALRGGSGGMPLGSPVEVSLYYRDGGNNIVPVAATEFLNEHSGSPTSLLDVIVDVPTVLPGDAWANQNIGVRILSTVELGEPELQGGTWGIDRVRLDAGPLVPAISSWGLIVLALGIVAFATLTARGSRRCVCAK